MTNAENYDFWPTEPVNVNMSDVLNLRESYSTQNNGQLIGSLRDVLNVREGLANLLPVGVVLSVVTGANRTSQYMLDGPKLPPGANVGIAAVSATYVASITGVAIGNSQRLDAMTDIISERYGASGLSDIYGVNHSIADMLAIMELHMAALPVTPAAISDFIEVNNLDIGLPLANHQCFCGNTMIEVLTPQLADLQSPKMCSPNERVCFSVTEKAISSICPGDIVVSYDSDGNLKPGVVSRIFKNRSTHILDFWGTGVTPGHATLCGDGVLSGHHVPILDILRTDGAIVKADGTLIRAATNCEVGSDGDRLIVSIVGEAQPDGRVTVAEQGKLRAGTRVILADGRDVSVIDLIAASGGSITEDGFVLSPSGKKLPFWWTFSDSLPKPEDYILKRSDVTLEAIYRAGEWEQIGTRLAAPVDRAVGDMPPPEPNIPPAFANHPDAPRVRTGVKAH